MDPEDPVSAPQPRVSPARHARPALQAMLALDATIAASDLEPSLRLTEAVTSSTVSDPDDLAFLITAAVAITASNRTAVTARHPTPGSYVRAG